MSLDVAEELCTQVENYRAEFDLSRISVCLHGGEPLLLPLPRAKKFLEDLESATANRVGFLLQTNGMLVDKNWIELFSNHRVRVGISIDGPPLAHDEFRIDKRGRGTHQKSIEGYWKLFSAADDGLINYPSIISVLNANIDPDDYYIYITKDLKCKAFNVLLPDANYDNFDQYIPWSKEQLSSWLKTLFDCWWRDKPAEIDLSFFVNLVELILGGVSSTESVGSFSAPTIIIDTDGAVQAHDVLRMNGGLRDYGVNIIDSSISEIFNDELYAIVRSGDYTNDAPVICQSCPVFQYCKSGFVGHRYSSNNNYDNPSVYCDVLFDLITHVYLTLHSQSGRDRFAGAGQKAGYG